MGKPKGLIMKMHEANRPPEYLQAYPADEMDEYIDDLKYENLRLGDELSKIKSYVKTLTSNAALRKE